MARAYYCDGDKSYHCKSELPQTLRSFVDYQFSSGRVAEKDFRSFNTKYKNAIKNLLPDGYVIHEWIKGHYECGAIIKTTEGKFIYIHCSDVRFWVNEWFANILYRTMAHDKDWGGGRNHFTTLFTLTKDIEKLYR